MGYGMLWRDESGKSLAEKLEFAADYFAEKYGKRPCLCRMDRLADGEASGIKIIADSRIAKSHFLIFAAEETDETSN